MMINPNKIYKYPLNMGRPVTTLELPIGAKPLTVGKDPQGNFALWAIVDTKTDKREHFTVTLVGTGSICDERVDGDYISTIVTGAYVFHFFVRKEG
jgi:hypothetical protein